MISVREKKGPSSWITKVGLIIRTLCTLRLPLTSPSIIVSNSIALFMRPPEEIMMKQVVFD